MESFPDLQPTVKSREQGEDRLAELAFTVQMELWSLLSGNSIEATPLEALHHSADLKFMHLMHSLKKIRLLPLPPLNTQCVI